MFTFTKSKKKAKPTFAVKIPYVMGIIATRSLDEQVTGLHDLRDQHLVRIRNGIIAYGAGAFAILATSHDTEQAFEQTKHDLGYGLLLKRYTDTVTDATEQQIQQAADDSIPTVWPLFYSFRIMVGCGFIMLFVFGAAFLQTYRKAPLRKSLGT
ncbi:cytochrome ubiquinol oxidase subunit I [Vibrio lentus]|nr:cytochrome ubiquinol oxidase subunit I [Vibrio lentus]